MYIGVKKLASLQDKYKISIPSEYLYYYPGSQYQHVHKMLQTSNKSNDAATKQKKKAAKLPVAANNTLFSYWKVFGSNELVPTKNNLKRVQEDNSLSTTGEVTSKRIRIDIDLSGFVPESAQEVNEKPVEFIDGMAIGEYYNILVRAHCLDVNCDEVIQKIQNGESIESFDANLRFRIFVIINVPSKHYRKTKPDGLCGYRSEYSMYKSTLTNCQFVESDPDLHDDQEREKFKDYMKTYFASHKSLSQILSFINKYQNSNPYNINLSMDMRYWAEEAKLRQIGTKFYSKLMFVPYPNRSNMMTLQYYRNFDGEIVETTYSRLDIEAMRIEAVTQVPIFGQYFASQHFYPAPVEINDSIVGFCDLFKNAVRDLFLNLTQKFGNVAIENNDEERKGQNDEIEPMQVTETDNLDEESVKKMKNMTKIMMIMMKKKKKTKKMMNKNHMELMLLNNR